MIKAHVDYEHGTFQVYDNGLLVEQPYLPVYEKALIDQIVRDVTHIVFSRIVIDGMKGALNREESNRVVH